MFEELSDIFSDHNNHLTSRELLMKVRLWVMVPGSTIATLESIQGKSSLRALYVPAVPQESLKWPEGRIFVFYAKSKRVGAENIQRPAPQLHLCNQIAKFVLVCVSL